MTAPAEAAGRARVARIGRILGPLLAALVYAGLPESYSAADGSLADFSHAGRATAAVAVWMATWWLSEAIEIYATALLPLLLFPLLGANSIHGAASPYAHELIFLFLGGFLIALAMQRWGLHRRMALTVLGSLGDRPSVLVGGFMGVTALLSMWVSNTAAAIMMLPVALSVIDLVGTPLDADGTEREGVGPVGHAFAMCLLLGIAYAASIGGIATPIGTPPNLFLLSFLKEDLGREISFVRWMGVGLPLVAIFLPISWWLLTRVLHPIRASRIEGSEALLAGALTALGPMRRPERIVLAAFAAASTLWVIRPLLTELRIAGAQPLAGLTDTGIALGVALVLFVLPAEPGAAGERRSVLDWKTARELPWGILLLFGGGLSLAASIRENGVAEFLGAQVSVLSGLPSIVVVVGVVALVVFLTELTSNTATTATFVPLLAALAPGLGLDPLLLAVPAALAASCAFMLPVATPPNAIVFGSGLVTIRDMSRAGLALNLVGIVLITALAYAVVIPLLAHPGG